MHCEPFCGSAFLLCTGSFLMSLEKKCVGIFLVMSDCLIMPRLNGITDAVIKNEKVTVIFDSNSY